MIALLVVITFLALVIYDIKFAKAEAPVPEVPIRASQFPVPGEDVFLTGNHLLSTLAGQGRLWLQPDSFVSWAVGPERRWLTAAAGSRVNAGQSLFSAELGTERLELTAPWSGRVVTADSSGVLFQPDSLPEAMRRMRIGKEVESWWRGELKRLGRFLATTGDLATAMADGGDLVKGFAQHLSAVELRRFSRIFLEPGRHASAE